MCAWYWGGCQQGPTAHGLLLPPLMLENLQQMWSRPQLHPCGRSGGLACPRGSGSGSEEQGLGSAATPLTLRMEDYVSMPREEAAAHMPVLFIAPSSAKDPTWEDRFPGGAFSSGRGEVGGRLEQGRGLALVTPFLCP